jgi:16S rRNA (guanine527-N7)-methyltransferase
MSSGGNGEKLPENGAFGAPPSLAQRFNVSRESLARLEIYADTLRSWQQTINLVGGSTLDQLWERHIADSLQVLRYLSPDSRDMVDLGAGAGFPGLVVAIASGRRVHLIESNGKKCAFLREAIRKTGAEATIHQSRIEELRDRNELMDVSVILARALAPLPELLDLAEPLFQCGAVGLFHKGQDVATELTKATKYWKVEFVMHESAIAGGGVILEVREAHRVKS